MRIIGGVLQVLVGLLFAGIGAILCFFALFDERPDWAAGTLGVLMLLGGVGCIWNALLRASRG